MSDTFLLVLKLVGIIVIGALIGAITNHLAIRMLFRPLEPKYIGKFRVPFTPGLIPKRRDELAANLGRTVVKHLLTPEGIGKRLASPAVRGAVTRLVEQEVMKWTRSEETTEAWISRFIDEPKQRIQGKISYHLEQEFSLLMGKWREKSLRELIGEAGEQKSRRSCQDSSHPYCTKQRNILMDQKDVYNSRKRLLVSSNSVSEVGCSGCCSRTSTSLI